MRRSGGTLVALFLVFAPLDLGLAAGEGGERKTYEIEKAGEVLYGKGGDVELKLDYARPREPGIFPGVLCIHGGGWAAGKRQDFAFLVDRI